MSGTCRDCSMQCGDACYRRIATSPRIRYRYEKRKVGLGLTDWRIGMTPRPRCIAHPDSESCRHWTRR
ncbi:MAG TPA: hypothetical protein VFH61_14845 [Thermoleophilia bacterium]|nr:hypothetical protein [Thermoleophilia bacterium]